jgi:hypothetical protein
VGRVDESSQKADDFSKIGLQNLVLGFHNAFWIYRVDNLGDTGALNRTKTHQFGQIEMCFSVSELLGFH